MNLTKLAEEFRVPPDRKVKMKDYDPGFTAGYEKPDDPDELLAEGVAKVAELQERLYAENRQSLLVIFKELDGAGKVTSRFETPFKRETLEALAAVAGGGGAAVAVRPRRPP